MDLVEVEDGNVTPGDYKHGRPRETKVGIELWARRQGQLVVQAIVLRDNGYRCEEGLVYYRSTRQRVRVRFTADLIAETVVAVARAREVSADSASPPDSPKYAGCSLVPICLADETQGLARRASCGR